MYIGRFQPYYSFATTCVDKKDGPLSGLFAWGCEVQNPDPNKQYGGIFGAVNNKPAVAGPPVSSVITGGGSGGTTTSSGGGGGGGTPASKNCGGCDAGNIGCELGKAFCEFSNFGKNWWDGMGSSISKGTGGMGLLPMIAIGGGLLLLVVVIAK